MKNFLLPAVCSAALLSACGPQNGADVQTSPEIEQLFDGANLKRELTDSSYVTYISETNDRVSLSGKAKNIRIVDIETTNDGPVIQAWMFGKKVTLTPDGEHPLGSGLIFRAMSSDGKTEFVLWTTQEDLENYINGTSDMQFHIPILVVKWDLDGGESIPEGARASAVLGTPTALADMPHGAVTYSGVWHGRLNDTATPDSGGKFETDIVIDVNFRNGSATGVANNYRYYSNSDEVWKTSNISPFYLKNGNITGNTLTADLTYDVPNCSSECNGITRSEVDLDFYGDEAQELAGTAAAVFDTDLDGTNDYIFNGVISTKSN